MESLNIFTHAFHTVIEYYWFISLPTVAFFRGDVRDIPWWWDNEMRSKPDNCFLEPLKDEYDLAIAHTPEGYKWIKKQFDIPIIYWFHQYPDPTTFYKVSKLKLPKNIPAVYYSKEEAEEWGFGKPYVIKHGIDCSVFNGWTGEKKKAMSLASSRTVNWGDMKGHSFLEQIRQSGWSRVFYSIYGGDVYLQTEEEVLEVMRSHRVYMNIAWKLDRSPLEAMACGMPTVARMTSQFTLKDYFRDGENIFFIKTPKEMIDRVSNLLEDHDLCKEVGKKARQIIKEHFSLEENAQGWLSLFKEVLNEKEKGVSQRTI